MDEVRFVDVEMVLVRHLRCTDDGHAMSMFIRSPMPEDDGFGNVARGRDEVLLRIGMPLRLMSGAFITKDESY